MKIADLEVSGVRVRAEGYERIPKGIVGAQIGLKFTDSVWDGLQKTVVFRGAETKTVLNAADLVTIPREVVSTAGVDLMVGVCGTDGEGTVMIPTLWAELGKVWGSALPTEDTSTDSSLPIWAQIQAMVGDLNLLITEDRESLVKAVNELAASGGPNTEQIQQQIADYLERNPPNLDVDKAEVVSEVLAALPLWTGGSF